MAQAIMNFLTFRFITHPLFSIQRLPFYRELKIQIFFFDMPNSQPDKGVFKKVSVYEDAACSNGKHTWLPLEWRAQVQISTQTWMH